MYFLISMLIYINIPVDAANFPYVRQSGQEIKSGVKCENTTYYSFDTNACVPCLCDKIGSMNDICGEKLGQCYCKAGYNGKKCTSCSAGYYRDLFKKTCIPCHCSKDGSKSIECNHLGQCQCKRNIVGRKCNRCLNLGLNFRKECTENCPEMYLVVARSFEKFDRKLNEMQSFLIRVGLEKNKMDELTAKINGLKEETAEGIEWMDGDLLKLRDAVIKVHNQIKIYAGNAKNLYRLQGITKAILKELRKINNVVTEARNICVDACNKADAHEQERKRFLSKLNEVIIGYNNTSMKANFLENAAKILKNQAGIDAGKANATLEKVNDLHLPDGILDDKLMGVENKRLLRILQEIDEMKKDAEKMSELYEETKKLQEDSTILAVEVLDEYVERYKTGVKNNVENILESLEKYEDELKNISSLIELSPESNISSIQHQVEYNLDKLQEFKVEAEKIIADSNLTQEAILKIFDILDKIQFAVLENTEALEEARKSLKKEEAILDETNAEIQTKTRNAIRQMGERTEALEKDLAEIETDLKKTEKEVESLEDILSEMQTLIMLSKEVANLKAIREELNKIPSNITCRNINLV